MAYWAKQILLMAMVVCGVGLWSSGAWAQCTGSCTYGQTCCNSPTELMECDNGAWTVKTANCNDTDDVCGKVYWSNQFACVECDDNSDCVNSNSCINNVCKWGKCDNTTVNASIPARDWPSATSNWIRSFTFQIVFSPKSTLSSADRRASEEKNGPPGLCVERRPEFSRL